MKQDCIFNISLITFFMSWNIISFFHSQGKLPVRKQILKIMFRGQQIESLNIFSIRMLISSWAWALFGSRLLINRRMPSFAKWQKDVVLSVRKSNSEGKTLLFGIWEHWLAKKELKISLFSWKSTINLSPWNSGGMQRIFFPLNSAFKNVQ